MAAYLVRRLLAAAMVLFGVSLLVFMLIHSLPGDTLIAKLGETGRLKPEQLAAARHEMGLDRPLPVQYGTWLGAVLRGDLGKSLVWDGQSVGGRIADALPISLELAIIASLVALVIAIPLGIISAVNQDTVIDQTIRVLTITGLAIPSFWLGTVVIIYLGIWFHYLPPLQYTPIWEDPRANLQQFYIPGLLLGYNLSATLTRMTRSTVLEMLRHDFVRTARAKGLMQRTVLVRHVLKNALIPVVTIFGNQFAFLLGGTVIMEVLFVLPGLGRQTLDAVLQRDYPQIQGNALLFGTFVVLTNIVVDLTYAYLDPRIRYH
jgi:peptide/nickel transport system permease protein